MQEHIGSEFNKYSRPAHIAKQFRRDVKKFLPEGVKLSVRSDSNSIQVTIVSVPDSFPIVNDSYNPAHPPHTLKYMASKELNNLLDKLEQTLKKYGRFESDIMTDYFNYSFYPFVDVHYELINKIYKKSGYAAMRGF